MSVPVLSVVLATHHPWPASRTCLEPLREQAQRLGVQVILADGDGAGLPEPPGEYGFVERVVLRDTSIFALRAEGVKAATGDIIAFTEDHCEPTSDWCERIIAAHAAHPEADAIGGALTNGTPRHVFDRAGFYFTFSEFVTPVREETLTRCPPPANVSVKRRLLEQSTGEEGWLEFIGVPTAFLAGRTGVDERIVLAHHQALGTTATLFNHFQNGRASTGLIEPGRRGATIRAAARRMGALGVTATMSLWRRGRRREALRDGGAIVAVGLAHSTGELVGLLRGVGQSHKHMD